MVSDEYAKARKGLIKAEQTDNLQSSSAEGTRSGKKRKTSTPKSYASALQKLKRTPRPLRRESSSDSISSLESQSEFTVPLAPLTIGSNLEQIHQQDITGTGQEGIESDHAA